MKTRTGQPTPLTAAKARQELHALAKPRKTKLLASFFKSGPGQYAEGDRFIGVTVPDSRSVALRFGALALPEVKKLLDSPIHEERLLGLLILVERYFRSEEKERETLFDFYMCNTAAVNNWDLVDLTAPNLVGKHLQTRSRKLLYKLARSPRLWDRRIAIVATQHFIRQHDFTDTLKLAVLLMNDKQDLMHKAVGWMLREMGKRDVDVLRTFLNAHTRRMPRTMLRYSLERLPLAERQRYMAK